MIQQDIRNQAEDPGILDPRFNQIFDVDPTPVVGSPEGGSTDEKMTEDGGSKTGIFSLVEYVTRRSFLRSVAAVSMTSLAVPSLIIPRSPLGKFPEGDKILSFYNIHTGETLNKCVFWEGGNFNQEALKRIQKMFRDHRTNQEHPIDLNLLSLLHKITKKLETTEPIQLVSGYRSPKTNGMLRKKSRKVACESQHLYGKAADIYIPGRTLKEIGKAAKSLNSGGVGRYSHFVHVDTGPVRSWGAV